MAVQPLKRLSLKTKSKYLAIYLQILLVALLTIYSTEAVAQPANLVNNGGFEQRNPNYPNDWASYWAGLDSTKYFGLLMAPPYRSPKSSFGFQYPHSGECYFGFSMFISYTWVNRGYPRNFLKQTLTAGKVYCVTFYVALTNVSSCAVDAIGAYFGDASLDTIKNSLFPLTYLSPQISNPTNHIISDTLNWTPITGTFVAQGNEKYMVLGNFKSNANTNTVLTNPAQLPTIASEYFIDDVSVIELDLPAFAGEDRSFMPGDSVYLGRESDVGIDEACVWYKLPSPVPIDTVAGLWVKPTTTSTYVVVQTICGNVKRDTVMLFIDGVGVEKHNKIASDLTFFPNPTRHEISIVSSNPTEKIDMVVQDVTGRIVFKKFVVLENFTTNIRLDLEPGVYLFTVTNSHGHTTTKKIVIEN